MSDGPFYCCCQPKGGTCGTWRSYPYKPGEHARSCFGLCCAKKREGGK